MSNSMANIPMFEHFTSASMYKAVGLKGYEPMTAKEIETEEQQDECFDSSDYFIEEKFDGTRALLYFLKPNSFQYDGSNASLLKYLLLRGSGFVEGKNRIYEYFVSNHSGSDRVNFLKKEYGIGGCSIDLPDRRGFIDYNAKGFSFRQFKEDDNIKWSWAEVRDMLSEMIDKGEYYPYSAYTRCFSRRVSEKTKWYCENTDSLPHLRDLNIPELSGTVIDGEMFIPGRPFKDVSSTLNCKWDKAIERQEELGKIVFHAFDILFYKGIDLRKMPLHRRKVYLQLVIDAVKSPYIKMVDYQRCGSSVSVIPYFNNHGTVFQIGRSLESSKKGESYPYLFSEYLFSPNRDSLSPRAFYEYIVATGGEGVMIKPVDGKYYHKRGREYQKVKKFLTREVIVMGFLPPSDEYKGKFPTVDKWDYWETHLGDKIDLSSYSPEEREEFKEQYYPSRCRPISKFYCYDWIGTIRFGVIITPEEISRLPKNKKFNIEKLTIEGNVVSVLEVGECSGFDEDTRSMFSNNPKSWVGKVIEVKANEVFKDTGKLRHPRFLRVRDDKSPVECGYKYHVM